MTAPAGAMERASLLRPRAHGELDHAFELCPSCTGRRQDGHAADDRSDVMGQGRRIGVRREIAFGTGALETLADRRMAGDAELDHGLPDGEESSAQ